MSPTELPNALYFDLALNRWLMADSPRLSELTTHVQLPNGLWVTPQDLTRSEQPVELQTHISTYVTATEAFGPHDGGLANIKNILDHNDLEDIIQFSMRWQIALMRTRAIAEVEHDYVQRYFQGDVRQRLDHFIEQGRRVVVQQALTVMVKLAMVRSASKAATFNTFQQESYLAAVPLFIADQLGTPLSPSDTTFDRNTGTSEPDDVLSTQLFREVVSNAHFNAPVDVKHMISTHFHRWIDIPRREAHYDDIPLAFESAIGLNPTEWAAVGFIVYSAALADITRFNASYFDSFRLEPGKIEAALLLVSATRTEMRDAITRTTDLMNDGLDWDFSSLEQFPLVHHQDGSYQVLSARFLLNRFFGWLPVFDIIENLRTTSTSAKDATKFETSFRLLTEMQTREVLNSVAPSGIGAQRIYGEEQLKTAYGKKGVKIADAAIDYGHCWIVVEISTRQINRISVASGEGGIERDVAAILDKIRQLDSTITQLSQDETKLTGHPVVASRSFAPVLVTTEGFPVDALIGHIRAIAVNAGLLQQRACHPLEIVTRVELEMVEAAQEQSGLSFNDLLEGKRNSHIDGTLRNYMIDPLGLGRMDPSTRVKANFKHFVDDVMNRVVPPAETGD